MANHGFVTTRRKLTWEKVDADIREINERRFDNILSIEVEKERKKNAIHYYFLAPAGMHEFGFSIWLVSPHKLEFRHPHSQWGWWAQVLVYTEELAAKYNGTISDEGVEEKWKGDPKKYPTFMSWTRSFHNRPMPKDITPEIAEQARKAGEYLTKLEWDRLPKLLKDLDEKTAKRPLDELAAEAQRLGLGY